MIIQTSHSFSKKINHSITKQTTNKHTQQPFNQRNKEKSPNTGNETTDIAYILL